MIQQPMVDAHVHLWDPAQFRYAWLDALPALNQPFLPRDYAAANAGTTVNKFICVECGCEPEQHLVETDWLSALAKGEPRLQGIVAHASLEKGAAVRADLEKLAARPLVKGIRRNLQGENNAAFCLTHEFIAGVQLLAEFGFTFDLCLRAEQLRTVAELARRVPQVTFVLNHFGKPDVNHGTIEPWATDLKLLAALPNVACKISGLATEANWHKWQAHDLKFYFDWTREWFGPERLLFGSDWPVATLATSYPRWVETVQNLLSSTGESDQIKIFQTNAERIYHV